MSDIEYIPNRFLEKAVQDQDVDTVKLALRQLISADPCFKTTRIYSAIKYVESHGIKLYEDTFRQDLEIITDCSKWNDDYFAEAMVNLQFNFRQERLDHVKKVGQYLYSKPVQHPKQSAPKPEEPHSPKSQRINSRLVMIGVIIIIIILLILLICVKR